jgi:hypothetical protein
MTLVEFIHPFLYAKRPDLVLAVLLYHKYYVDGSSALTASEIRKALVQARVTGAKNMNIRGALASTGRYADQLRERGPWRITKAGEDHLLEEYGVTGTPPTTSTHEDVTALRHLVDRIPDKATSEYVDEALECLQVGARRAAVVFIWSGAVSTIRDAIWAYGASSVEAALQRHNPKAKFAKQNDFDYVKDADLLQAAQDLGVFDKSQKRHLGDALNLRNDCGHPVKYAPGQKKVESFIEDVVGIVWP